MFSTSQFLWDGTNRLFVAEASQLGFAPGETPPDPITVQSAASGQTVTFHAYDVLGDERQGELYAWAYKTDGIDCELHILND